MSADKDACRVLLVEDNPDDEFLANWVLKSAGIAQVSVARDGREALDILLNAAGSTAAAPDLVILDLRLPKIGGIEVLQRLRDDARTANLPVLVLSSSEDPVDRESCRRLGIIAIVSKPLTPADLRKAMESIGKNCAVSGIRP